VAIKIKKKHVIRTAALKKGERPEVRDTMPDRVVIPPDPTYDDSDPALRDEQQVARVELLMLKGIRQKRQLMLLLNVADHRQMDRYISRVQARWELVGANQDYSRARGEGLQRLDLIESELWAKTQNMEDARVSQTLLQTILNVHRHRMDLLGLTPKVIEHIGIGTDSDVAFSKTAGTHERLSMLAARMMRMIEERTKVIEHAPADGEA
jgi:hypothetical protein